MVNKSKHMARVIEERRLALGLTPTAFEEASELSLQQVKNLREGWLRKYQDVTILGVAKALHWDLDWYDVIRAGGEPTSLNGFHPVDEQPDRIGKLEADLSQLHDEVRQLRAEGEQLALDVEESRAVILRLLAIRPDVGVGEAPPSAPEVGQ